MCVRTASRLTRKISTRGARSGPVRHLGALPFRLYRRLRTRTLVEYSTELRVEGAKPLSFSRQLRAGAYLVEIRERDIDLRVKVDAGDEHTELADAYQRHGLHRTVVSLAQPATVRITLASIDQRELARSRRGAHPALAASRRRMRRPTSACSASWRSARPMSLIARRDSASWRAAIHAAAPGGRAFRGRERHAGARGNGVSAQRLASSICCSSSRMAAGAPNPRRRISRRRTTRPARRAPQSCAHSRIQHRSRQWARKFRAPSSARCSTPPSRRAQQAQAYFEAQRTAHRRDRRACMLSCMREQVLGRYERAAPVYRAIRARARARGDKIFEVRATQNLALIAERQGKMANPWRCSRGVAARSIVIAIRICTRRSSAISGHGLIALGEFDRALMLHTEALELFSARGDESQTARELAALASIQFRSGNVERALDTIESALPLYERGSDQAGLTSRRCVWQATRRPSSVSTTPRSDTCGAPNSQDQNGDHHRPDARAHRR